MKITVIPATDLTPDQIAAWSRIQDANSALASPFFCPGFTLAIAEAAGNIFVGVLHDTKGVLVGFFPFEIVRPGFAKHLDMCDYQGVVASPSLKWGAKDLIRGCGLKAWDFDHLLASQAPFSQFHRRTAESPLLNISNGFEAYRLSLSDGGKRQLSKAATSTRKVERELGTLRFVQNTGDLGVMGKLYDWRAGKYGPLPRWAPQALEILRKAGSERFAGILSALYAGPELIAAHFGIRSRTVWHFWLPAYNPQFRQYSPGILLLLKMAQCGAEAGITTIDLGKGSQDYKRKLQNGAVMVAEGSVDLLTFSTAPRIVARHSEDFIRKSPVLLESARTLKRLCRSVLSGQSKQ